MRRYSVLKSAGCDYSAVGVGFEDGLTIEQGRIPPPFVAQLLTGRAAVRTPSGGRTGAGDVRALC